jgi:23S rRNA-/tRNA-specific pseudouridylate synthase
VHLASLGHPIAGDPIYGVKSVPAPRLAGRTIIQDSHEVHCDSRPFGPACLGARTACPGRSW